MKDEELQKLILQLGYKLGSEVSLGEYSLSLTDTDYLSTLFEQAKTSQSYSLSPSNKQSLMNIQTFSYEESENLLSRTIDIRATIQEYSSEEVALNSIVNKALEVHNTETETTVYFEWETLYKDHVEYVATYTIPGDNYYNWKLMKNGKPLKVEIRYRYTDDTNKNIY